VKLLNGSEIWVVGMDRPERIEGPPWDGGVLDEYGNMKAKTWGEHVRPALSDRRGWCWLIGVPEGRNHYYDMDQRAILDDSGEWGSFHWKSADILPAEEIEAARNDLDELTFQQEYEGSFIRFEGQTYYPFQRRTHAAKPLPYNKAGDLWFCFDFNVNPGVCAVAQQMQLPNGLLGVGVIGEVYIPQNSNTPAVCRKLIADWEGHEGRIFCYGDATGGAKGTAKIKGSDWDLVKAELRPVFGGRVFYKVPRANPREKVRVNCVNSLLMNGAGEIRLMVDPAKAPHVVKDFEGVQWLKGGAGEIDKAANPLLTHLTDGIGYCIVIEYPIHSGVVLDVELVM
jgi:hypothetical protein